MLSKIFQFLPTELLSQMHIAINEQFEIRGCQFSPSEEEDDVYVSKYRGFTIKIEAIPNGECTCLYSVFDSSENLLATGSDFSSTMGESEYEARKWIDENQFLFESLL